MYCGRENPDNETFCECGRPLKLGGSSSTPSSGGYTPSADSPFASQTLDSVKRTRSIPWTPIIILILACIGVGVFFGLRWLQGKHVTDEASWQTIDQPMYSIKVPSDLDKGEMLTVNDGAFDLLDFYTSRLTGFNVYYHKYVDTEKQVYSGLTIDQFNDLQSLVKRTVNGQEIKNQVGASGKYIFYESHLHRPNYIKKSDEIWYIEALFPLENSCYFVDIYCAEEDKDEYRESLFKMLDTFEPKI